MSGMPFRLDIVETGEQWVVTCATPHGKAVSRIPAPFSTDALHRVLADIEKALIRSYSPVTTRRAAPVDQAIREFGETLSDAVLTGDVRRLFDRCREDARERQTSLRILLDTDGPMCPSSRGNLLSTLTRGTNTWRYAFLSSVRRISSVRLHRRVSRSRCGSWGSAPVRPTCLHSTPSANVKISRRHSGSA